MISNVITETPYPGLRPFTREESDIFFGREEQTDQLLAKIAQTRFISVVGLSGCGKSSLVRAGLIPNLESGYLVNAGPHWRIALMRPSNRPIPHLAEALLEDAVLGTAWFDEAADHREAVEFLLVELLRSSLGLVEALRKNPLPGRTNLLIVVDQFEELFRHHREGGRDETEAFVNLLLASAAQNEIPIYVVITMRSEFIGNCAVFYDLPEVLNQGQFLVPRLRRDQQEMTILGPAGVCGGMIEEQLVNTLLNEMGQDPDQLPLLQHCLMRMWTRRIAAMPEQTEEVLLSLQDYEVVGGLKNALSKHADEAFKVLDKEGQRVAEILFRRLSEGDIRRPTPLREVVAVAGVPEAQVMAVVEAFRHPDRCFLMPAAGMPLTADTMLDISHESLIRQWQRMNEWVEEETKDADIYRRYEQSASLWKDGETALLINPELKLALDWKKATPTAEWARRYGGDFHAVMEFLNASEQAQKEKEGQEKHARAEKRRQEEQLREERERQRELKLKYARRQLAVVIIGLVIALSLAVWAIGERSNTQKANTALGVALAETTQAKAEAENALVKEENAREAAEKAEKEAKEARDNVEIRRQEAEGARKAAEEQRQLAVAAEEKTRTALQEVETKRQEAENARTATEEQRQLAVAAEKEATVARDNAEIRRQEAESARKAAEEQRQLAVAAEKKTRAALQEAEARRQEAESARKAAEEQRQLAVVAEEKTRTALQEVETKRQEAEAARTAAEEARKAAEEQRQLAVAAEKEAKEARDNAEARRQEAETARKVTEEQRQLAVAAEEKTRAALQEVETKRQEAETARTAAEEARKAAEEQRQLAVAAEKEAKEARDNAEARRQEAETARKAADEQRQFAVAAEEKTRAALQEVETRRQEAENARKTAEEQRQIALAAEKEATAARDNAEARRQEAEEARKAAEEQRQLAVAAEKKTREASDRFQEMVTATFGFFSSKAGQTKEFLVWIEKTFTAQKFIPALNMLINSSGVDEAQKEYWRNELLKKMTPEEMVDLLEPLGRDVLRKVGVGEGLFVPPIFYVDPGKDLRIHIDVPPDAVEIEPITKLGMVTYDQANKMIIYRAPVDKPGNRSVVRVDMKDKDGKTIGQQKEFIMKIRERTH